MDPHTLPLGQATLDIEFDANNIGNNVPGWLRAVFDGTFNVNDIGSKKKVASDQAIASLQECDINKIDSSECPICYEAYEIKRKTDTQTQKTTESDISNNTKRLKDEFFQELNTRFNLHVPIPSETSKFNDPSVFVPLDQGASNYARFPVRNLVTLQKPSEDDILPGYNDLIKERERQAKQKELIKQGHFPVKMPNCAHVFGQSCIVEWLKSNVSCPLCRKEVEQFKEKESRQQKLEKFKDSLTTHFNDPNETYEHVLNHSTDVFNPYRRPFVPSITPLTDSYMSQNYAASSFTLEGNSCPAVNSREPNLVVPGKFPIPDINSIAPLGIGLGLRHVTTRREPVPYDADDIVNFNEVSPESDDGFGYDDEDSSSNDDRPFGWSSRTVFRRGLERARRSGRAHPYTRPSSEEA